MGTFFTSTVGGGGVIVAASLHAQDAPTAEPPTIEPSTLEPPTLEPPTLEPPTAEPPTVAPTLEPATVEPPTLEPPTLEPPTIAPTLTTDAALALTAASTPSPLPTDDLITLPDAPAVSNEAFAQDGGVVLFSSTAPDDSISYIRTSGTSFSFRVYNPSGSDVELFNSSHIGNATIKTYGWSADGNHLFILTGSTPNSTGTLYALENIPSPVASSMTPFQVTSGVTWATWANNNLFYVAGNQITGRIPVTGYKFPFATLSIFGTPPSFTIDPTQRYIAALYICDASGPVIIRIGSPGDWTPSSIKTYNVSLNGTGSLGTWRAASTSGFLIADALGTNLIFNATKILADPGPTVAPSSISGTNYAIWHPTDPNTLFVKNLSAWYKITVSLNSNEDLQQDPPSFIPGCDGTVQPTTASSIPLDSTGNWLVLKQGSGLRYCSTSDVVVTSPFATPNGSETLSQPKWRPSGSSTPVTPVPPTPVGTATLSPQQLATVFPLPMRSTPEARLSDLQFVDRGAEMTTPTPVFQLCTRDVNAQGVSGGNHPIISSAAAQVYTNDSEGSNGGLGNFVSLIMPFNNLPTEVKQRLIANVNNQVIASYMTSNIGYLIIGYGHLQRIDVPLTGYRTFPATTFGQQVGLSGKTGREDVSEHLDVGVFYVTGAVQGQRYENPTESYPGITDNFQNYFSTYFNTSGGGSLYGPTKLIDPLWIWPLLGEGLSNIESTCERGR